MEEKIRLKHKKEATFAKFFSNFMPSTYSADSKSANLVKDYFGNFIKITEDVNEKRYVRNVNNDFEQSNNLVYSGYVFYRQFDYKLNNNQKNNVVNLFTQEVSFFVSELTGTSTSSTLSHVEFVNSTIDDIYLDIDIVKTFDFLDTLTIRNVLQGEWSDQESSTGVIVGRLVAIQKISDENGNKIEIPLKNCPVSIFNPSDTFQSPSDIDDDGNRLSLNVLASAKEEEYFDKISYKTDLNFLRDYSNVENIPSHFKYTSTTNENGEFVMYDVPVGTQTFIIEVDLLKQGLSKDEVALNFFSYPAEENPIVDTVPHYVYKQFQVNVLPSWGIFASGYTFYNFRIPNLDLRKWCTYIVPPISYKTKTIEENYFSGKVRNPLQVLVRDMTKENFEIKKIQVAEVFDIYERDYDQNFMWSNEISQLKDKAEFRTDGFHIFKLPANLYDPNGIGTNGKRGVWLNAYQLKMIYVNSFKATGSYRINELEASGNYKIKVLSHFDLNYCSDNVNFDDTLQFVGVFPYEKMWSLNYPDRYSIPKKPSIINTNKTYGSNGEADFILEPRFLDGDLVGGEYVFFGANGYGLQGNNRVAIPNDFSRVVSSTEIYKYERGVRYDESYSNGYLPNIDLIQRSFVVNGEKWQRLESGYGYFLLPFGYPRIKNMLINGENVDQLLNSDYNILANRPIEFQNYTLDTFAGMNYTTQEGVLTIKMEDGYSGSLDIYRINSPVKINPRPKPFLEKFVKLNFQSLLGSAAVPVGGAGGPRLDNLIYLLANSAPGVPVPGIFDSHGDPVPSAPYFELQNVSITIWNLGAIPVNITLGGIMKTLEPTNANGSTNGLWDYVLSTGDSWILPSNSGYDVENNSFNSASYEIRIRETTSGQLYQPFAPFDGNSGPTIRGGNIFINNIQSGTEENIQEYYLSSRIPEMVWIFDGNAITKRPFIHINGFTLNPNGETVSAEFLPQPITTPNQYIPFLPWAN
jgi:hypothetical protein